MASVFLRKKPPADFFPSPNRTSTSKAAITPWKRSTRKNAASSKRPAEKFRSFRSSPENPQPRSWKKFRDSDLSMRFLMLNWRDPKNPISGGAERVTLAHLAALAERGHQVYWYTHDF